MRVFIIDTRNLPPQLQGGLVGVIGSLNPSLEEKAACINAVTGYAVDGWVIAADPLTPIGRLAALTAEAACVPFLNLSNLRHGRDLRVSGPADNRFIDSAGVGHGID